jgi:hypothetical protein
MKTDLLYMKQGLFTAFIPESKAGEDAWRELAKQTDGTGKVFTHHLKAVISQLRKAGYTVRQAEKKSAAQVKSEMAEIIKELERREG